MRHSATHFCARHNRGFTLIEILIVGSLIVLFAGIAVINIQEIYKNNVRKAALGETNQLGVALSMAHQDLGFLPKLGFLILPDKLLINYATAQPPGDDKIYDFFDTIGYFNEYGIGDKSVPPPTTITERWQTGGYFSMSQGRNNINQGRGGSVRMRVAPHVDAAVVDWPADPWGNPYVVYLLKVDETAAVASTRVFWRFTDSVSDKSDYKTMAVSYGPNGVPGVIWRKKNTNDRYGTGTGDALPRTTTAEMVTARLFLDNNQLSLRGFVPRPGSPPADFTMIGPEGYNWDTTVGNRAEARDRTRIIDGPDGDSDTLITQWNGRFPAPTNDTEIRGILDPGSDDLVFEF